MNFNNTVCRKRAIRYLAVTFAITYFAWGLRALLTWLEAFPIGHIINIALFYLGGFAPMIASLIVLEDKSKVNIKKFLFGGRRNSLGYLIFFIALFVLFCFASTFTYNEAIPVYLLPLIWLNCVLLEGGNEEFGWRGVLQPELEKKFSFPIATLITSSIWAVWHLPFWFTKGDGHTQMSFLVFSILGTVISFVLAALKKRTDSNLFCVIMHGTINFSLSVFAVSVRFENSVVFYLGMAVMIAISLGIYYGTVKMPNFRSR